MLANRPGFTVLALLASLAGLAPLFLLVPFAYPQNDDWVAAVAAIQNGLLSAAASSLHSWTGRYTALLLDLATPLTLGSLAGWRVALGAYMLVLPLGTLALVWTVAPPSASRLDRLAAAAGIAALFYASIPNPANGLFWLNGLVCYGVGEGLGLAGFAALLRAERPGGTRPWGWSAVAALLAALAAGTNEVVAMLMVGSVGLALARARALGRPWRRIAVVLLVATAALAVALLTPGTLRRFAYSRPAEGRDAIAIALSGLETAGVLALGWSVKTPVLPVAALLAVAAARIRSVAAGWAFPRVRLMAPVAAAAYLGTATMPLVGEGVIRPHTLNLVHDVFIAAVLLVAVSAGASLPALGSRLANAPRWLTGGALAVAVVLALLPGSAVRDAWTDLATGRATGFDAAMMAREEIISRCGIVCEVPRVPDPPRTLFWFDDAVDEAKDTPFFLGYKDRSYGLYHGKARIRLAPEPGAAGTGPRSP